MSRTQTYIMCPICKKEFQSLGYASHRAGHKRRLEKAMSCEKLKETLNIKP